MAGHYDADGLPITGTYDGLLALTPTDPSTGPLTGPVTGTLTGTLPPIHPIQIVSGAPDASGTARIDLDTVGLSGLLSSGTGVGYQPGTLRIGLYDGYLNVDAGTPAAAAERLYEGLLGRHGDSGGLEGWAASLSTGVTLVQAARGFMNSPEYGAIGAPTSDGDFVARLYRNLLGREPEQEGLDGHLSYLAGGGSRADVAAAVADSPEARAWSAPSTTRLLVPDSAEGLVYRAYESGLGRAPDQAGLASWTGTLRAGASAADLMRAFAASPEFLALHSGQDDTAYVDGLYASGLGRAPDPQGEAGHVAALAGGAGRGDVLLAFAGSPEAQAHGYGAYALGVVPVHPVEGPTLVPVPLLALP